jgi:RNA polymerase sigma-70 factor (ECF subfamily)
MESGEFYNQVKKAVDQLSPKYRAVFVLRAFQEMNYEEISNTLKISRGTVMSRLNRARKKLQKLLQKWMVD